MCGEVHLVVNVYHGRRQDDGNGELGDHDISNEDCFLFILVL